MVKRYKIVIEYLGTNFSGWQKQKNNISIQEAFEKAARKLLQEDINSVVAGRTDSGVHASGQVVHFDINKNIEDSKLLLGLNYHLSKIRNGSDISVKKVKKKSLNFSARFSARRKHYQYKIHNANYRSPLLSETSWWVRKKLDVELMKLAANNLIGNNNYNSFRAKGCQASSPIKTINDVKIIKLKNLITINFIARSFLYKQVRIMVGTLRDVGLGYIKPDEIKNIISKKNRQYAGITAPARGLTLTRVYYK